MTLDDIDAEDRALRIRRDELAKDVRDIGAQLADRGRRDPETGQPLTGEAYQQWRKSAFYAQRCKTDELAAIKRRLHELAQARDRLKRKSSAAARNQDGSEQDWKPIVMRALAESQEERDRLRAAIESALSHLATARQGTKAAEARDVLRRALGPDE